MSTLASAGLHAGRLLRLAAFLDTVPRHRFDYNLWVGHNWQGRPDLSCGTAACAMGWATTMTEFWLLGLVLDRHTRIPVLRTSFRSIDDIESGFIIGKKLFGLDGLEYPFLFSPFTIGQWAEKPWAAPGTKATAPQVADHIRRFVSWKYAVLAKVGSR